MNALLKNTLIIISCLSGAQLMAMQTSTKNDGQRYITSVINPHEDIDLIISVHSGNTSAVLTNASQNLCFVGVAQAGQTKLMLLLPKNGPLQNTYLTIIVDDLAIRFDAKDIAHLGARIVLVLDKENRPKLVSEKDALNMHVLTEK